MADLTIFSNAKAAVHHGDLAALQAMLQAYPELPNFRPPADERGHQNTLLHECTGMATLRWPNNAPAIAQALIKAGADPNAAERPDGGETPLIHAVSVNNAPVAEVLLQNGADTERRGRHDGTIDTALGYALFYGTDHRLPRFEKDCPDTLLQYGASCYLPFAAALGQPLHSYFTKAGHLLPEAAAASDQALTIQQALLFACKYGQIDVVNFLLQKGAELNQLTPFFHFKASALHLACENSDRVALVRFLLEKGADPELRDGTYQATAKEWAVHCGQEEVARLFE